jgi:ATP-dependent Clp protease ATP-binding subunit ClpA
MFERFTERARYVCLCAEEEARTMHHNYIGTEHLLLGLLREGEGLAARILQERGFTLDNTREAVIKIVGSEFSETWAGQELNPDRLPFTPRSKKVLELALRDALSLGHNYIGTEHILLGMVRENEGVAVRIITDRCDNLEDPMSAIREDILHALAGPGARRRRPPRPSLAHGENRTSLDDVFRAGRRLVGALTALGMAITERERYHDELVSACDELANTAQTVAGWLRGYGDAD